MQQHIHVLDIQQNNHTLHTEHPEGMGFTIHYTYLNNRALGLTYCHIPTITVLVVHGKAS